MKKLLIGAMGTCVHAAGIYHFALLAQQEGYRVENIGSSNPIKKIINAILEFQPDIVALSYRLSGESLHALLTELIDKLEKNNLMNRLYIFGGTIETATVAKEFGFFSKIFDGTEEKEETLFFLKKKKQISNNYTPPNTLKKRIEFKKPFPLIRHHIGLNSVEETAKHVSILSKSKLIDIISIAPDQNCQQYYFTPEKMNKNENGAGGVPIRKKEDLIQLYKASQKGNYPLLRCYSGTKNLLEFSKILSNCINNAWSAIPLTWYSDLDRRSNRDLLTAIKENQEAIEWNAKNNIPVEINESHQWALRYCSDTIEVTTAYIAALNAKKLGVKDFIMQFMLCTPPSISPKMDIAKMIAKIELIQELEDDNFKMIRMIRTGLLAYPSDPDAAKGLAAASIFYGAYLKPDIVHAVSYTEAIKRATSKEIIETIKIVKKSLSLANLGLPNFISDPEIYERIIFLKKEVKILINAIENTGSRFKEPLTEPEVIYNAISSGILDAPGLKGFSVAQGKFHTEILNGTHVSIDENNNKLDETARLKRLGF